LRTVQCAWAEKKAVCFKVTHQGGKKAFRDRDGKHAMKRLARLLNKLMIGKRAVGHFLVSDLEWLNYYGIDPIASCPVPLEPKNGVLAWERLRNGEGWLDTAYMNHAVEETAPLGLEMLTMRYTTAPRYDIPLEDWKKSYCQEKGIKSGALEGYGNATDKVLVPYACLHHDSLVQLGNGTWAQIGSLVASRYSGTVKALKDGKVINARVTNWHRAEVGQKDWFKVKTASMPNGRFGPLGPVFTPDHKVLTQRGKVAVESLRCGVDTIATDETMFSSQQLSVFLGSLLGDGGFTRKNDKRGGFGFGQKVRRAEYAHWKAEVFANYTPTLVGASAAVVRYTLPFSHYLCHLAERFPTHPRKSMWKHKASRIACRRLTEEEAERAVSWLTCKFGDGVSYNGKAGFIQFCREAFGK